MTCRKKKVFSPKPHYNIALRLSLSSVPLGLPPLGLAFCFSRFSNTHTSQPHEGSGSFSAGHGIMPISVLNCMHATLFSYNNMRVKLSYTLQIRLEADKYVTSSLVIPMIEDLREELFDAQERLQELFEAIGSSSCPFDLTSILQTMIVDFEDRWGDASSVLNFKYSTSPRLRNRVNRNHLGICLSSPEKNGNRLTWVLAALPVCLPTLTS